MTPRNMIPQPTFEDVLHAVESDWRPSRVDSRERVRQAVMDCARDNEGLVHASTLRPYLPEWVAPAQIGAVVNLLVRKGYLVATGRLERSGRRESRDAAKWLPVRKLVRPVPVELVNPRTEYTPMN